MEGIHARRVKQGAVDSRWLAELREVAPPGWGGRCGAEQREARRSHCRLRRRRELGSAARVAVLVGPGSLRGDRPLPMRALRWTSSSSSTTPALWFGASVALGRIRGHRAVRMLRTSGRMSPGGPPTGTETSTFVLRVRVRACVRVRLCLRAGGIVCMRARQARPGRGGRSIRN